MKRNHYVWVRKKEEIGPRCATENGRAAYEGLGGGNWPHVNFKNFCLLEDENDFNVYWNWLQQIWSAHIDNTLSQSQEWRINLPKIIYYHFVEFWLVGGGQQRTQIPLIGMKNKWMIIK